MEKFQIKIESILGGISPTLFQGRKDQFAASIGIDPDLPITDSASAIKTAGVLRSSFYNRFSSLANMTGVPLWLVSVPDVNSTLYAYCSDGKLIEYTEALTVTTENVIGIPVAGAGGGAAFYNNYLYCATTSSIARFGPLDVTQPVFNNDWWGNELGFAPLGNALYPLARGVRLPNQPMHVHNDGNLYVGDYDDGSATVAYRGKGLIHKIRTRFNTATEGIENESSEYAKLSLPYGYMPTDIESFGTSLAILAIPVDSGSILTGGKAKLFIWDTLSLSYDRAVDLPDPIASALYNSNGTLYIWSGNFNFGVRVSVYAGGYSIKQVAFFEEGITPPAGAVDGMGNRVVWGAMTTYPESSSSVYALGYKNAGLPLALHNIAQATATTISAADGMISALKYAQQASFRHPRLIIGWRDASEFGLDKLSGNYRTSVWRSLTYYVGKPFKITKIILPLGEDVGATHTLIPTIGTDETTSVDLVTINNTNYPSVRRIIYEDQSVEGKNDFYLQLRWSGTGLLPVIFPIIIEGETIQDGTR